MTGSRVGSGMRTTALGAAALVAGAAVSIVSWLLEQPTLALGGTLVLVAFAVELLATAPLQAVEATREVPARSREGATVPVRLDVDLGARWPRLVSLRDEADPPGETGGTPEEAATGVRAVTSLRLGWQLDRASPGCHRLGPASLTLHGPLGLVRRRQVLAGTRVEVHALPAAETRTDGEPPTRSPSVSLATTGHQPEGDDEFHRLRSYQPGDRLKDVNWKASQRALARGPHADPIVTVRTEPSATPLVVVLDARGVTSIGPPGATPFAGGTRLAARLLERDLDADRSAGLVILSDRTRVVEPGRGFAHRERLLHELAAGRPGGASTLGDALSTMQQRLTGNVRLVYVGALVHDPGLPGALERARDLGYDVAVAPVPVPEVPGDPRPEVLQAHQRRTRRDVERADVEVLA